MEQTYLMHHGIKGMHWGQHTAQSYESTGTAGNKKLKTYQKAAGAIVRSKAGNAAVRGIVKVSPAYTKSQKKQIMSEAKQLRKQGEQIKAQKQQAKAELKAQKQQAKAEKKAQKQIDKQDRKMAYTANRKYDAYDFSVKYAKGYLERANKIAEKSARKGKDVSESKSYNKAINKAVLELKDAKKYKEEAESCVKKMNNSLTLNNVTKVRAYSDGYYYVEERWKGTRVYTGKEAKKLRDKGYKDGDDER